MKAEKDALGVNDQFLRDFIAKGGKAEESSGKPVDASNLDQFLAEVAGPDTSTPKQEALHARAVAKKAADTAREDEKAAERVRARNKKLAADDEKRRQGAINRGLSHSAKTVNEHVVTPMIEKTGAVVDKISSAGTAGGVGLLLVILVFLLFVIVQVNAQGDTRLKQFWYMLNGRAQLQGQVTIEKQGAATTTGTGTIAPLDMPLLSDYRLYT